MCNFKTIEAENVYIEGTTVVDENSTIVSCDCCNARLVLPKSEVSDNVKFLCEVCTKSFMRFMAEEELIKLKAEKEAAAKNDIATALGK